MTTIDLNFSTDLTSRNQALNAIAVEIKQAFNLVAAVAQRSEPVIV